MINSGWRGEYYLQQDLEGRRKLLKRLVGSLHLEPATRQRVGHFDMERIPDRYKLDPDAGRQGLELLASVDAKLEVSGRAGE